jgi:hypothetical protein
MGSYSAVGPHFLSDLLSDSAVGTPNSIRFAILQCCRTTDFCQIGVRQDSVKLSFCYPNLTPWRPAAGMGRAATKEPVCRPGRRKRSGPLNSPIGRPKKDALLKLDLYPKVDEAGGKGVGDGVLDVVYVFDPGVGNDVFGPDEV